MNPKSFELPDSPFADAILAARVGRYVDAIDAVARQLESAENARALFDDAAGALAQVARWSEAAGDLEQARRGIDLAIRLRPRFPDLHVDRARLLLAGAGARSRESRAEARRALDTAIALHPGYATARLERALLDASEGLIGEALEALRTLGEQCAPHESRAFEQAIESLRRADWEEAAELLRGAIPPEVAAGDATLDRAREALERGDDAEAARLLRSSLPLHSAHPDVHLLLGSAEFRLGHLDDGLMSVARALEINPDYHAARVQFARILDAMGQTTQAAEQAALVLERDPSHPGARALVERWSTRSRRSTREFTARNLP
jgi:tetratricopeptide (TPR) repeat protein